MLPGAIEIVSSTNRRSVGCPASVKGLLGKGSLHIGAVSCRSNRQTEFIVPRGSFSTALRLFLLWLVKVELRVFRGSTKRYRRGTTAPAHDPKERDQHGFKTIR